MKRILVCEDEDAIRDFVVINLVRSGYDVVDVSCGEDAVKVYTCLLYTSPSPRD